MARSKFTREIKNDIAIVGSSVRLPQGCDSSHKFWEALLTEKDLITEVSDERWNTDSYFYPQKDIAGKSYTKSAGQLENVWDFDADFFNISPREAAQMDPQQRLLLEMSWEAFETAGIKPSTLQGTNASVCVGISSTDFGNTKFGDTAGANSFFMLGTTMSIASNRLSYFYDLHGSSFSVDTACSSSLYALEQACARIHSGQSDLAICGGVSVLLTPFPFIGFSQANMLSPDGRCKAFDSKGNGYVRSEGGGVLILKRVEDALKDGNPIIATVAGVGTNSDGRTNGMSLPSTEHQENLLRSVYASAEISTNDVSYIEAHGTGTIVGDAAEVGAIGRFFGEARPDDKPLLIGSAKSNVGHLEAGSGMVGLIKAALVVKNATVPPSIHVNELRSDIPFAEHKIEVATKTHKLEKQDNPVTVGVNSFGFGGANGHAILRSADLLSPRPSEEKLHIQQQGNTVLPSLFLSAKSEYSLKAICLEYADILANPGLSHRDYEELAASTIYYREDFPHRFAVTGENFEQIKESLLQFAEQDAPAEMSVSGHTYSDRKPIAFIFNGNGSQFVGMAKELLQPNRTFNKKIQQIDAIIQDKAGWSIVEILNASTEEHIADTTVAQPLIMSIQIAITEALKEQGILPTVNLGHSVGEIAAAYSAGHLNLEQAVTVILNRSNAQGKTRGSGKMAAIEIAPDKLEETLHAAGIAAEIAGYNGPTSLTVSGREDDLDKLDHYCKSNKILYKKLDLDYPFHSSLMDSIETEILTNLGSLTPQEGNGKFVSTVSGNSEKATTLTAQYWWENIRKPVQFHKALETAWEEGCRLFIEIGPKAILGRYVKATFDQQSESSTFLPSLTGASDETRLNSFHQTVYVSGGVLDFTRILKKGSLSPLLPTYQWDKQTHYLETTSEARFSLSSSWDGPLLGERITSNQPEWKISLGSLNPDFLQDHVVNNTALFPAAGYLEIVLSAGRAIYQTTDLLVEELEIHIPLALEADALRTVTVTLDETDGRLTIRSRPYLSDSSSLINATAKIQKRVGTATTPVTNHTSFEALQNTAFDSDAFYEHTHSLGLEYGPAFRTVQNIFLDNTRVLSDIELSGETAIQCEQYILHPGLLDGCLQSLFALLQHQNKEQSATYLPSVFGRVEIHKAAQTNVHAIAEITRFSARSVIADFTLIDEHGDCVAILKECRFRQFENSKKTKLSACYEQHFIPTSDFNGADSSKGYLKETLTAFDLDALGLPVTEEASTVSSLLEALVSSFILEALETLEVDLEQGFRVLDLIAEEKIDPVHSRYFSFLLNLLKEDELLLAEGDRWSLDTEHERYQARDIWNLLVSDYPDLLPELTVIGRTGDQLAAILQGKVETDELPANSETSLIKHLIEGSAYASQSDAIINNTVLKQFTSQSEARKVTLIEFDSHNIQGCKELVKSLPKDRFEYRFISADPDSYHRAKLEFLDVNGVICQQLDSLAAEEIDNFITSAPKVDILIFRGTPFSPPRYEIVGPITRTLLKENGRLLIGQNSSGRIASFISGGKPEWWDRSTSTNQLRPLTLNLSTWDQQLSSNCHIHTETLLNVDASSFNNASVLQGIKSTGSNDLTAKDVSVTLQENDVLAVIISDCLQEGELAARILKDRGPGRTYILSPNEDSAIEPSAHFVYSQKEGFDLVAEQLHSNNLFPGKILYLAGLTLADEADATSSQKIRCGILVDFLKSFAGHLPSKSKLLVATHASQNVTREDQIIPLQAPLWGLTRVISNEYPDIDCKLLDFTYSPDSLISDATASTLLQELEIFDDDREIVRVKDKRFTSRLRKSTTATSSENFSRLTLNFSQPGALENLQWYPTEEAALQGDQIEIEMKATGLNFRDVMWAMGVLKDEAVENGFAGPSLGMEGAGIVTRIGSDVQDFEPGDRVMCFAPRCFADYVVTNTTAVAKLPDSMAYTEAATIPSVFFTIYYALNYLARIEPGEKVLIHGAAGGVGLAAIQYCQHIGAKIYVTAGSDEKRDFLKLLGCPHILDSRSLEFADQIMELTGGEGIDVVLNSLSGEAIARNLAILKPFGRFLELGKRDFYADSKIGLRPFRNNITYYGIDADQLLAEKPGLSNKLFTEMMTLFEEEVFKPLVHLTFKPSQIEEAFRTLQQSKHIGKIVVSMEDKSARKLSVAQGISPAQESVSGGCCLITGGQSGFGLATAKEFAAPAFDHLVLVSRSGVKSAEDQAIIDTLRNEGTTVSVIKADVTNEDQLKEILNTLRQEGEQITGIIHCAMVLDDGLVSNMEKESLDKVCAPKITGAWHLHNLTKEDPVRLFLLYSSATTYIGNPGQGSYVAANSYLEALAKFRHKEGLPALAVAWGAIDDVGVLSDNTDIKEILVKRTGLRAISSSAALSMLNEAMIQDTDNLAILQLDWENITKNFPSGASSRYNDIRHLVSESGSVEDVEDFMISIDGKSHEEIVQAVQALVLAQISTITGSAIEKISPEKSLFDLGIDSLMALELVMELERKIGIEMSSMSIMGGGNIADLSEKVTSVLLGDNVASDENDDLELLLAQHGATDMITTEESSS